MTWWRCPECRTRRKDYGLLTQHLQTTGHRVCTCGGYHYPHRAGSPYCHKNPMSMAHEAARRGETEKVIQDIVAHCAMEHQGKRSRPGEPPPF